MSIRPNINVEDDPTPIVKIVATHLKKSAQDQSRVAVMNKLTGCCNLVCKRTGASTSVSFSNDSITVRRYSDKKAYRTISIDMNQPFCKQIPLTLKQFATHPLFTLRTNRLFAPHQLQWKSMTAKFWNKCQGVTGIPRGIKLNCTDTTEELVLGDEDYEFELFGDQTELLSALSGATNLMSKLLSQKLHMSGRLEHLNILVGINQDLMMGESP